MKGTGLSKMKQYLVHRSDKHGKPTRLDRSRDDAPQSKK